MPRYLLVRLRARLDASTLPRTDPVWLDLDSEITRLMVATAPTVRAIRVEVPIANAAPLPS